MTAAAVRPECTIDDFNRIFRLWRMMRDSSQDPKSLIIFWKTRVLPIKPPPPSRFPGGGGAGAELTAAIMGAKCGNVQREFPAIKQCGPCMGLCDVNVGGRAWTSVLISYSAWTCWTRSATNIRDIFRS